MSTPADDMTVVMQRASALCELRRFADAVELLSHGIASDPQNPDAWSLLATAQLGAGNVEPPWKRRSERSPWLLSRSGHSALPASRSRRLDRIEESIHHARDFRLDHNSWPAYTMLARSLAKNTSDLPEAREVAERQLHSHQPKPSHTSRQALWLPPLKIVRQPKHRSGRLCRSTQRTASRTANLHVCRCAAHVHQPFLCADAACGFATSLLTRSQGGTRPAQARAGTPLVLGRDVSYFIFLDAYLIARISSGSARNGRSTRTHLATRGASRIRVAFGQSTEHRSPHLPTPLLPPHYRQIRLAVVLDGLAVACLFAAALVPEHARVGLAGGAAVSSLTGSW